MNVHKCKSNKKNKAMLFYLASIVIMIIITNGSLYSEIFSEPNDEVTYGTPLTIHFTLESGKTSAVLEIIRDKNRNGIIDMDEETVFRQTITDTNEKTVIRETITGGGKKANFEDKNPEPGEIAVIFKLDPGKKNKGLRLYPGQYIIKKMIEDPLGESINIEVIGERSSFGKNLFPPNIGPSKSGEILKSPEPNFAHKYAKGSDLWMVNTKSPNKGAKLTSSKDCSEPAFSPDGRQIAYVRVKDGKTEIWSLPLRDDGAAGEPVQLAKSVEGTGNMTNPLWSPNSKWIAYIKGNALWLMNRDGSGKQEVVKIENIKKILAWLDDNKNIIVAAKFEEDIPVLTNEGILSKQDDEKIIINDSHGLKFWKVDVETKQKKALAYDYALLWLPNLSRDKSKYYSRSEVSDDVYQIRIIDVTDLSKTVLIRTGYDASWSGDGHHLVIQAKSEHQ